MRVAIVIVLGALVSTLSLWYGHFRDVRFLREVIESEKDPFTKLRYQKVLCAYLTIVVLFLLGALLFFQATN